jgi:hypothetical protein
MLNGNQVDKQAEVAAVSSEAAVEGVFSSKFSGCGEGQVTQLASGALTQHAVHRATASL